MNKRLTTEEFLRRARAMHGDKYDYSQVEYRGRSRKVSIGCPVHGWFRQKPAIHYLHGCPECGRYNFQRLTTEEFIRRARALHGDRYDYGRVHYVNLKKEVEIVCPRHGPFWISPNSHLRNRRGCPMCAAEVNRASRRQRAE